MSVDNYSFLSISEYRNVGFLHICIRTFSSLFESLMNIEMHDTQSQLR